MNKLIDTQEEKIHADIIRQLRVFGYTDVEGKSLRELKLKLALLREVESPNNAWW
jgi:hypothetical protein